MLSTYCTLINSGAAWINREKAGRGVKIKKREGGSFDECLARSRQRQSDDMDRYRELYGMNLDDMSPYNLIIDADEKDEDEVFEIVVNEMEN